MLGNLHAAFLREGVVVILLPYLTNSLRPKIQGFEKRAQYYAAQAYSRQADKGDQYH